MNIVEGTRVRVKTRRFSKTTLATVLSVARYKQATFVKLEFDDGIIEHRILVNIEPLHPLELLAECASLRVSTTHES